jgi:protein gp37
MSANSSIEWTDTTWNPVRGCTKVSPGCAHCYAETFAERFRGVKGHPYEQGFDLWLVPEKLTEPLSWKKPRRVFVNSMSDLFQDGVSDSFIQAVFTTMAQTPRHTYQVLTKRPERMQRLLTDWNWSGLILREGWGSVLPNVWLGVSVENQHFSDERIPLLLQTPAAVRFISAEPLLEAVDLRGGLGFEYDDQNTGERIPVPALDWVIVGGESGHGARPFDIVWARSIISQCKAAGVACFVKQLGSNADNSAQPDGTLIQADLNRKGGNIEVWPEDLRVREFPSQAGNG